MLCGARNSKNPTRLLLSQNMRGERDLALDRSMGTNCNAGVNQLEQSLGS